jgi:hypothetical protein
LRAKIKTSELLTVLGQHAFGERKMEATQIKCAEILLRKVLPDLVAMEISGDVRHFVVEAPSPAADAASWLADRDRRMIDVTPVGATVGATVKDTEENT